MILKSSCLI